MKCHDTKVKPCSTKGGLISESFSLRLKSPEMGAKSRTKEKMPRVMIWHPLLEI